MAIQKIKVNPYEIKKILILQYKPFGDVLLNTAYLPALRKKFTEAKIDFLVYHPYEEVLIDNSFIDELIILPNKKGLAYLLQRLKLFYDIRKRKYDMVIDQLWGIGSAEIVLFSGAKFRLGYKGKFFDFVYNIKTPKGPFRYYAAMKFDLLKPLGITEESYRTYYKIRPESIEYIDRFLSAHHLEAGKFITVAPGSPVPAKKWNPKYYAQLCDLIIEYTPYQVVFVGAPGEEEDIKNVRSLMKNPSIVAPRTTFNQAAALLSKSRLLICNDGGINHLAIAINTPSLAFFGATEPLKWSGYELGNHFYIKKKQPECSQDDTFGITVDEAFNKVKDILEL